MNTLKTLCGAMLVASLASCDTGTDPKLTISRPDADIQGDGLHGAIAFHSIQAGTWDIWIMNADGTGATRLTDEAGDDFGPRFSPNGGRIAFSSSRDGDFEICVVNSDGTGFTPLTHTSSDFEPTCL